MNIMVIGGNGLVGPYVLLEIIQCLKDSRLSTVTRSGRALFTENAFQTDRKDLARLEKVFREASPDFVVDMIPFSRSDARDTSALIREISPDIHVVVVSSIDVYSAYAKIHATEDVPYQLCPIGENMSLRQNLGVEGSQYDKLSVERIYFENLKNVTVLRFPAIYGWPDTRRVSYYLDPMLSGEEIISLSSNKAKWRFSRCSHRNAAYAALKVIEAAQTGHHIYNVAEEPTFSEREWCERIAAICGWRGRIVLTDEADRSVDFCQDFYVSSEKIRHRIGFSEKYSPYETLSERVKLYALNRAGIPYKQCY